MDPLSIAALLGIVEGLTEFLPVSSTGHLILVGHLMKFFGEKETTFEIVIQSGAILAVLLLYWRRFLGLLDFSDPNAGFKGRNGIVKLAVACAPAFLLGALLHKPMKALFVPPWVAAALIIGGLVMLVVEARRPKVTVESLEQISLKHAFLIGLAQCIALWPGISRSGSTIVAAMLLGISRGAAAEFSFLLATPVLIAATGFALLKGMHALSIADLPLFAVGFVVSFLSALIAVKGFIKMISHWTLRPFAWYRLVLGAIVIYYMS